MQTKKVVWTGPGVAEVHEGTVHDPGSGEVLVETQYTLISPGTEREWLRDDTSHAVLGTTFPFTPGYSYAGTIAALGDGVEGWQVGANVVGLGAPLGAHASHQVVPAATLLPVPESVAMEHAVLYQLGGTALHAVQLGAIAAGESVGIVGQGPIGQIALQAARALHPESPTLAMDLESSRLETALRLGAAAAVDPTSADELASALGNLGGGVSVAVDLSGSPAGTNTAIGVAAGLGRVVLSTGFDGEMTLNYGQIFIKGLTLVGAFVGARPAEFGAATAQFLQLVQGETVVVGHLVEERFVPEDTPKLYEAILAGDRSLAAPLVAWK